MLLLSTGLSTKEVKNIFSHTPEALFRSALSVADCSRICFEGGGGGFPYVCQEGFQDSFNQGFNMYPNSA